MDERLEDRLVCILKLHILAHESDVHLRLRVEELVQKLVPFSEVRLRKILDAEMIQHKLVELLRLHVERHGVYRRRVHRLNHMTGLHIAEESHLPADFRGKLVFRAADNDVRLHTVLLKHLHRMLRRLGLKLLGCAQVRHESQVDGHAVLLRKLPLKLAHRLDERLRLHVSHRSSDLRDDNVILTRLAEQEHAPLDLVRDVRHDLHRLAEISSLALTVDHRIIYASCGDIVGFGRVHAEKTLIMSEIQVGLSPILRDIALTVLIRVERARIDVDIRIEFLDGDTEAPRLKKFCKRRRYDSLAQRRSHTA